MKCDKIFDLLLKEKQIELSPNHVMPSGYEWKKKRYCKWHNSLSHTTSDYNIFWIQIQIAIEQGQLQLTGQKMMKVEGHLFPINMASIRLSKDEKGKALAKEEPKTMLLTSAKAKAQKMVNAAH